MVPRALNSKKFAEYIETIQILYLVDDDFKAICDDYATSKTGMEKYHQKTQEDSRYKEEYESLSLELEKEILRYLKNRMP